MTKPWLTKEPMALDKIISTGGSKSTHCHPSWKAEGQLAPKSVSGWTETRQVALKDGGSVPKWWRWGHKEEEAGKKRYGGNPCTRLGSSENH